jgi:hypothetical protein
MHRRREWNSGYQGLVEGGMSVWDNEKVVATADIT